MKENQNMKKEDNISILAIKIDKDILKRLKVMAKSQDRSMASFVRYQLNKVSKKIIAEN